MWLHAVVTLLLLLPDQKKYTAARLACLTGAAAVHCKMHRLFSALCLATARKYAIYAATAARKPAPQVMTIALQRNGPLQSLEAVRPPLGADYHHGVTAYIR